jgi:hypothetical protein
MNLIAIVCRHRARTQALCWLLAELFNAMGDLLAAIESGTWSHLRVAAGAAGGVLRASKGVTF